jgi:hypothetical protein
MRREPIPRLRSKQLATITKQDVIDAVEEANAGGKDSAAHHLSVAIAPPMCSAARVVFTGP